MHLCILALVLNEPFLSYLRHTLSGNAGMISWWEVLLTLMTFLIVRNSQRDFWTVLKKTCVSLVLKRDKGRFAGYMHRGVSSIFFIHDKPIIDKRVEEPFQISSKSIFCTQRFSESTIKYSFHKKLELSLYEQNEVQYCLLTKIFRAWQFIWWLFIFYISQLP